MQTFYTVLGFVLAVCIGVIVLSLFYAALSWLGERFRKRPPVLSLQMKVFLREACTVDVHTVRGMILRSVKIVGFTEQWERKNREYMPHQLLNMIVLEGQDGRRTLVRVADVRVISEVGEGPSIIPMPGDGEAEQTN